MISTRPRHPQTITTTTTTTINEDAVSITSSSSSSVTSTSSSSSPSASSLGSSKPSSSSSPLRPSRRVAARSALSRLATPAHEEQNITHHDSTQQCCCVCFEEASTPHVTCDGCGACIHEACLDFDVDPKVCAVVNLKPPPGHSTAKLCLYCRSSRRAQTMGTVMKDPSELLCTICGNAGFGIMVPTKKDYNSGTWVHLICSRYTPGVVLTNDSWCRGVRAAMEAKQARLDGLTIIPQEETCAICNDATGLITQCGICDMNSTYRFHAFCAVTKHDARLLVDLNGVNSIACARHQGGGTTSPQLLHPRLPSLSQSSSQESYHVTPLAPAAPDVNGRLLHCLDVCGICFDDAPAGDDTVPPPPLLICDGCGVRVHAECYGVFGLPGDGDKTWWCRYCHDGTRVGTLGECVLCSQRGGALAPVENSSNDEFCHTACALYVPEISFGNSDELYPVRLPHPLSDLLKKRGSTCSLCHRKCGACIQCCDPRCFRWFHATCAALAGNSRRNNDEASFLGFLCRLHSDNPSQCATSVSVVDTTMGSGAQWGARRVSASYMWGRQQQADSLHDNTNERVYSSWCSLDDAQKEIFDEEATKQGEAQQHDHHDLKDLELLRLCVARAWAKAQPRSTATRRKRQTGHMNGFVDSSNYDEVVKTTTSTTTTTTAAPTNSSSHAYKGTFSPLRGRSSASFSPLRGEGGRALDLNRIDQDFAKLPHDLDEFMLQLHRVRSRDWFLRHTKMKCGPPMSNTELSQTLERKSQDPFFVPPLGKVPADRFSLVEMTNHFSVHDSILIMQVRPELVHDQLVVMACGGFPVAACCLPHHIALAAVDVKSRRIISAAHAVYWRDSSMFVRVAAISQEEFNRHAGVYAKIFQSGPPMNEMTFYPLQGMSWGTVLQGDGINDKVVVGDVHSIHLPFRIPVSCLATCLQSVAWTLVPPAANMLQSIVMDNTTERFFVQCELGQHVGVTNQETQHALFSMYMDRNQMQQDAAKNNSVLPPSTTTTPLTILRVQAEGMDEMVMEGTVLHRLHVLQGELKNASHVVSGIMGKIAQRNMARKQRLSIMQAGRVDEIKCLDLVKSSKRRLEEEQCRQKQIEESQCRECGGGDSNEKNAIVFCDKCDGAYHQECVGLIVIPEGEWFCSYCEAGGNGKQQYRGNGHKSRKQVTPIRERNGGGHHHHKTKNVARRRNGRNDLTVDGGIIQEGSSEPVYCVCRRPDDGSFFLQCSRCERWFHPPCLNLTPCQDETHPSCYLSPDMTIHPIDVSDGWVFSCARCSHRSHGKLVKKRGRNDDNDDGQQKRNMETRHKKVRMVD